MTNPRPRKRPEPVSKPPKHIACVGGPMDGRVIPFPFGKWVVFTIADAKGFRRAVYAWKERGIGEKGGRPATDWIYLRFQGWEKR